MNVPPSLKIIHLVSGAGGMYCGSCMHAAALASAITKAGHDVTLQPLYTPVRTDDENPSVPGIAFGGLNVFLQEKSALFRKTPRWLDRLLDNPRLLRWLSRFSGRTNAAELGALTVSMLRGPTGRQAKELEKLLDQLAAGPRPDVVHLSNALLAGLAGPIRRRLGSAVVVSLTGEDVFLERLPSPHREEAYEELRRCAEAADALVALSRYFADHMSNTLGVSLDKIHVVPPGLSLTGHPGEPKPPRDLATEAGLAEFRIGYFSRVCPDKGLHVLLDAVERIVTEHPSLSIRLDAAGYVSPEDRDYLAGLERRCESRHLAGRFRYAGSPDRQGKLEFLRSADVVCLPSVFPESKGLPALEAWAVGTPVVAPRHGAFTELVEDTGGGVLFEPGDVEDLVRVLSELAANPEQVTEMGYLGWGAVRERYHAELMAERTLGVYWSVVRCGRSEGREEKD